MAEPIRGVYKQRNPKETPLYQCIEDNYEEFKQVYDDRYEKTHGYWRAVVEEAIFAYLDCGLPELGFALLECAGCGRKLALPFSCKTRIPCSSCSSKRRLLFSGRLMDEVLAPVPHALWTFTVPKMLRPYFKFDRKLAGKMSLCAWESFSTLIAETIPVEDAMAGAVSGIHSAGKSLNAHPHVHLFAADGMTARDGTFLHMPVSAERGALCKSMAELFRHKVFKLLLVSEKITPLIVEEMLTWPHSGFNVHKGNTIEPHDKPALERALAYLLKPPFHMERMEYVQEQAKVLYRTGESGEHVRELSALDFLAELSIHIPDKGKHLHRFYGFCSNAHRGAARKREQSEPVHEIRPVDESGLSSMEYRRSWAMLIKKVFEADPLVCRFCTAELRIVGFVTDPYEVKKILTKIGLSEKQPRIRPPPSQPPPRDTVIAYDEPVLQ